MGRVAKHPGNQTEGSAELNSLPKPKAILFDLDDTILDEEGSVGPSWRTVCADIAAQVPGLDQVALLETISRERDWYWSDPDRHRIGRTNPIEANQGIIHRSLKTLGHDLPALARSSSISYRAMRLAATQPFAGAIDTLVGLNQIGVRMALITNGNGSGQRAKVDRFGLEKLFQNILIEGEFGCGKPDPRVYRTSMQALGSRPADTWMVGDNFEWEVAVPQRLGLATIWVDRWGGGIPSGATVQPSHIVRSVTEVLPLAIEAMDTK